MALALCDATFAVIDVETTGFDPSVDRVVELACAVVRDGKETDAYSSLINPGRSIPAAASAVHHLTNRHVQNAPLLGDVRPKLAAMCAGAIVVAHNARFDLGFLPFLADRPVVCSMRLAMRILPDAPNYKNQVLRYYLDIDAELGGGAIAHRARGDVQVTSRILAICLQRYLAAGGVDDVEHLVREIAAPRRLGALPFGRHRGVSIERVPADYLLWLHRESSSASRDARYTAERELQRRTIAS
jgi:DNA polymerase III alpha subunit (gram-positive type)